LLGLRFRRRRKRFGFRLGLRHRGNGNGCAAAATCETPIEPHDLLHLRCLLEVRGDEKPGEDEKMDERGQRKVRAEFPLLPEILRIRHRKRSARIEARSHG